jgi:hypothetical protein
MGVQQSHRKDEWSSPETQELMLTTSAQAKEPPIYLTLKELAELLR